MRVWRILKKEKFHPYKIFPSHGLRPGDNVRRIEYCEWLRGRIEENIDFLNNIIWTDECTFSTNGMFNRNNERYWARENPRQYREVRIQGRESFHVWVGLWRNRLIGPIVFEENLNSERYLNIIRQVIFTYFDDLPLQILRQLWWHQDGAPPHNARIVSDFLNIHFPNKWIGNQGPVRWPPRSPDLNPLDFFLWGYLKNLLYKDTPRDLGELRRNLNRECRIIRPYFILRAINKVQQRAAKCCENGGNIFEHLL